MKMEKGDWCPLVRGKCKQMKCAWFTNVRGVNPQTGQEVDEWNCAMTWMPLLMIDNTLRTNQTGSAIESFRNEMVKQNEMSRQTLEKALTPPETKYLIEDSE